MIKKTSKITIIIAGLIFFAFFLSNFSAADTIDEIQEKIDIANKNRAALEKEITAYQSQLKIIGDQALTLQNTIKSLDVSTNKITTEVKLTESNINKTDYTIENTGLEIENREKQIYLGKSAIINSLKQIYEADSESILEVLLSNSNLSDFWNDIEEISQIQVNISDQVNSVKNIKVNLEKAKVELEQKKKELEDYTNELNSQKKVLVSTKKEKDSLLSATKSTETNYQKILKAKLALKEALDTEINTFESQLKMAVDPKSFPGAKNGVLSWPVDDVYITQYFGKTSVSGRLYVSGTHNGIDFRAPIGTKIRSAAAGVVEGVGDTDPVCPGASYGKWVFIRYDNGLASAYGHLSLITAKAGQRVKAGDIVAYSGNTGYSTGPHLHMSVWAGQGVKISTLKSAVCKGTYTIPLGDLNAYLDPMIYLPTL
jgi:murein DD-endopeptidase MepM/ murein hydrolase activator NlpD